MKLSIIIVNWETKDFLRKCLESIFKSSIDFDYEVIVVDNNSKDGSVELVKKEFPSTVRLIVNSRNLGFAAANNQAIRECTGEYILLLNSDTEVKDKSIQILVNFLRNDETVGVVSGKTIKPNGEIDLTCRGALNNTFLLYQIFGLNYLFPNNRFVKEYYLTHRDHNSIMEVGKVAGACLMIRKKVIDEVGLLDERFFMYGEDLDWCYRISKAGWKIVYIPQSEIIHHVGGSSKKTMFKMRVAYYKSLLLFYEKHFFSKSSYFLRFLLNLFFYFYLFIVLILSFFKRKSILETNKRRYVKNS